MLKEERMDGLGKEKETYRDRQRQTGKIRYGERKVDSERETEREKDRERERERERQREI
jgi:colicin import membrane protein